MSRPAAHRRDERGALSSNVALAATFVVLAALGYYALTGGPGGSSSAQGPTSSSTSPTETQSITPTTPVPTSTTPAASSSAAPTSTPTKKPGIDRSSIRVGVYNNSSVSGLASRTATQVRKLGWNVVTVSNWSGAIPSTTVYYPPGLRAAAKLLAADLGVKRTHLATSTMPSHALSLILTGPLP